MDKAETSVRCRGDIGGLKVVVEGAVAPFEDIEIVTIRELADFAEIISNSVAIRFQIIGGEFVPPSFTNSLAKRK